MPNRSFGALDLGTSATTALIGEIDPSGVLCVRGVGLAETQGLKQGVVVDLEQAASCVRQAMDLAEQMAGVKMPVVAASITGDHISSINSNGGIALKSSVPGESRCITHEDVDAALETAQSVQLPMDKCLLHVVPQRYDVDGQELRNPVEKSGFRLQAETHLVLSGITSRSNLLRSLQGAGLRVGDLVFSPLAAAYATLSRTDLEHGVVLADIGGGTCDAAYFVDGALRHCWVFRYAGERVTRDVAVVLKTSMAHAERLKVEHGHTDPQLAGDMERPLRVPEVSGNGRRSVHKGVLARIIGARLQEVFTHLAAETERLHLMGQLSAGLVITGGVAATPGICGLAARVMNIPVRAGIPEDFLGPKGILASSKFAAALGLLLHEAGRRTDFKGGGQSIVGEFEASGPARGRPRRGIRGVLDQLLSRRNA